MEKSTCVCQPAQSKKLVVADGDPTVSSRETKAFSQCLYCLPTIWNSNGQVGYTTAVAKRNDKLFSLDSHSCCREGLSSASGAAVVMEAPSVTEFVRYFRELSMSLYSSMVHVPFEVVSLNCQELNAETEARQRCISQIATAWISDSNIQYKKAESEEQEHTTDKC